MGRDSSTDHTGTSSRLVGLWVALGWGGGGVCMCGRVRMAGRDSSTDHTGGPGQQSMLMLGHLPGR